MKCPNCLGEYQSNLLKCPYCGAINPEPMQENSCPNCHSINSLVDNVCTKCGYQINSDYNNIENIEKLEMISSKISKNMTLIKRISFIIFLLFFGLVFLLIFLLQRHILNIVKIIEIIKLLFFILGITLIVISLFFKKSKVLLIIGILITSLVCLFHIFSPIRDISRKQELIIDGVNIPTLYKYTNYNKNVLFSMNIKNDIDEKLGKVNYSFIIFNNPIPEDIINIYFDKLLELDYQKINYEDKELYVKNISDKCIVIFALENEIEYSVFAGNYQSLFKEER